VRIAHWLGAPAANAPPAPDARRAEEILHENARALFGPRPRDRHVYVMVTAPEAAAVSTAWADAVLEAGANVLRINAAHESATEWEAAIALIGRRAEARDPRLHPSLRAQAAR
jgi:pyruvate kinase